MNGLTDLEQQAMDQSARLVETLVDIVHQKEDLPGQVRHSGIADADVNELVLPIHMIQHTVMAQAAARAHPDLCRLLGHMHLATQRGGEWC